MNAGESGPYLVIPSNFDLTNFTLNVVIVAPNNVRTVLPMSMGTTVYALTVNGVTTDIPANYYATRSILTTDFPVSGQYKAQLLATNGTYNRISTIVTFTINTAL